MNGFSQGQGIAAVSGRFRGARNAMKGDFEKSGRKVPPSLREGMTLSSDDFSALLVSRRDGFVYVSGDVLAPQCAVLHRGNLFIDGALGLNASVVCQWVTKDEPLSVLGVRTLKAGAVPDVPVLIFESADLADPGMVKTLRGISHATLLVWAEDARALFDACMTHIAGSTPGSRAFRTAAEELVLAGQQTLADLGASVRTSLLNDNLHSVRYEYNRGLYVSAHAALCSGSDAGVRDVVPPPVGP